MNEKIERWKHFLERKNQIFERLAKIDFEISQKKRQLLELEKELLKSEILGEKNEKIAKKVNETTIELEELGDEKEKLKKLREEASKIEGGLKKEVIDAVIAIFKPGAKETIKKFTEALETCVTIFGEIEKIAQEAYGTLRSLGIPLDVDTMLPSRILFQIDTQTAGRLIPPLDFESPRQIEVVKKRLKEKTE